MLSDEDWYRFANGGFTRPVAVCSVPSLIADAMGAHTCLVELAPEYAIKLTHKHKLSSVQYSLIRSTIMLGSALRVNGHKLMFHYKHPEPYGWLQVVLKATQRGHRLWVCTCHKQVEREIKRKRRKLPLVTKGSP